MRSQHHSNYVSTVEVMHRCMITYMERTANMPDEWYISSVYDSCWRKGHQVTMQDVADLYFIYRPRQKRFWEK